MRAYVTSVDDPGLSAVLHARAIDLGADAYQVHAAGRHGVPAGHHAQAARDQQCREGPQRHQRGHVRRARLPERFEDGRSVRARMCGCVRVSVCWHW
jgi:hypothetical protein